MRLLKVHWIDSICIVHICIVHSKYKMEFFSTKLVITLDYRSCRRYAIHFLLQKVSLSFAKANLMKTDYNHALRECPKLIFYHSSSIHNLLQKLFTLSQICIMTSYLLFKLWMCTYPSSIHPLSFCISSIDYIAMSSSRRPYFA